VFFFVNKFGKVDVKQGCTTYGPRAACGPRGCILRPAKSSGKPKKSGRLQSSNV